MTGTSRSTRLALAAAGVLVATSCYGAGPVPSPPADVTVVFFAGLANPGSECGTSNYIGSVAIGSGPVGYLTTLPYAPPNFSCDTTPMVPIPIYQFDKTTGVTQKVDQVGVATNDRNPRLVATPNTPWWSFVDPQLNVVRFGPLPSGTVTSTAGAIAPAGLIASATSIYVGVWSTFSGKVEPNNPVYPCCNPSGITMGGNGRGGVAIGQMPIAGGAIVSMAVTPSLVCETSDECLVGNASSLFYFDRQALPTLLNITAFPKSGTSSSDAHVLGSIMSTDAMIPVGLAADDHHVVWTTSVEYSSFPFPPPLCKVFVHDLDTDQTRQLFATDKFSCMHAAIDGDSVYFAIVEPSTFDQSMYGKGIGRVSIVEGTFDSLALQLSGTTYGPRRVYVDGGDLYLVDPLAVAKLSASALDDRHDIAAE